MLFCCHAHACVLAGARNLRLAPLVNDLEQSGLVLPNSVEMGCAQEGTAIAAVPGTATGVGGSTSIDI